MFCRVSPTIDGRVLDLRMCQILNCFFEFNQYFQYLISYVVIYLCTVLDHCCAFNLNKPFLSNCRVWCARISQIFIFNFGFPYWPIVGIDTIGVALRRPLGKVAVLNPDHSARLAAGAFRITVNSGKKGMTGE